VLSGEEDAANGARQEVAIVGIEPRREDRIRSARPPFVFPREMVTTRVPRSS